MKNIHKTHNVLGKYCWTCRVKTEAGIPYWGRPCKGPITAYGPWESNGGKGVTEAIIWANGDIAGPSETRPCSMCSKHCNYPVDRFVGEHGDNYREVNISTMER